MQHLTNLFALHHSHSSLRVKLNFLIILFVTATTVLLQYYSLAQFEEASTLNLEHEGLLLSDTLEATTLNELAEKDINAIQQHINRLVNNRDINDIEINILSLTPLGSEIIASNVPDNIEASDPEEHLELVNALSTQQANIFFEVESDDNDPDDIEPEEAAVVAGSNHPDEYFQDNTRYMSITTPLIHKGNALGGINVKLSLHPLDAKLADIRKLLFTGIFLTTLIVLFGLSFLLENKIFGPLANMRNDMVKVAQGDLDRQLTASNREDEIGLLAKAFNQMTQQLGKTQEQLHQYLNPMAIKEAYRRAQDDPDYTVAEEKVISVLFVDIVSFTTTAEKLGPIGTVEYLNSFYDCISNCLLHSGGYIDKFVADEIICVFEGKGHALAAVKTAKTILDTLETLDDCQVRIGINSGDCIIADIGSRHVGRIDRTIIGDTVNVAQRLMTMTKPDSAVFSLATWQALDDTDIEFFPLEPQKLKGKAFPVKAFQITGKTTTPVHLPISDEQENLALAG